MSEEKVRTYKAKCKKHGKEIHFSINKNGSWVHISDHEKALAQARQEGREEQEKEDDLVYDSLMEHHVAQTKDLDARLREALRPVEEDEKEAVALLKGLVWGQDLCETNRRLVMELCNRIRLDERRKERERCIAASEDPSNIDMSGGSTGNAYGTAKRITAAIRAEKGEE